MPSVAVSSSSLRSGTIRARIDSEEEFAQFVAAQQATPQAM